MLRKIFVTSVLLLTSTVSMGAVDQHTLEIQLNADTLSDLIRQPIIEELPCGLVMPCLGDGIGCELWRDLAMLAIPYHS